MQEFNAALYSVCRIDEKDNILSLRKKISDSDVLNNAVASIIASYIRLVYRTSHWKRIGFEPLVDCVSKGEPVIVVLWHQRLMMTPYYFPLEIGEACSITSSARAGSMVGRIQKKFGLQNVTMSSHKRHVALSREVLGRIRDGVTVGFAADGPRGPARVCSSVPLAWARVSGKRVFTITYSARRGREAGSWDRMLLAAPWNTGVLMCREWKKTVPRRACEAEMEALRLDLQRQLDEVTEECDQLVGRTPRGKAPLS